MSKNQKKFNISVKGFARNGTSGSFESKKGFTINRRNDTKEKYPQILLANHEEILKDLESPEYLWDIRDSPSRTSQIYSRFSDVSNRITRMGAASQILC